MHIRAAALALTATLVPFVAYAQDPPAPSPSPDPQAQDAGGGRGGRAPEPQIRPYDRVITKDAKSDEGVFTVHRIKDRLYYEIPKDTLGQRVPLGEPDRQDDARRRLRRPGGGQPRRALGTARRPRLPAQRLVRGRGRSEDADRASGRSDANYDPILMAFNVEALGKDDAPVIEVTRLFTTDVPEFSGRTRVRARTFDASRSFVERAVSFPENIEIEATHTYNNPPDQAPAARHPRRGRPGAAPRLPASGAPAS